ncbi:chemerin-like receptor 1 [Stigmatopora argus]
MAVTAPYGFAMNKTTTTGEDDTGSGYVFDYGYEDPGEDVIESYYGYVYEYEDPSPQLFHSLKIMTIVISTLAFVLGVLGNGLVIWVTGFLMKKTVNTVWFLNLAVADFLFTGFLPMTVAYYAFEHWPFGTFMCKLHGAVFALNMYASVYILMVISIDRCVAVVFPVWSQNHRRVKKAFHVSLCVWALALILSIPHFVFRDTGPSFQKKDVIYCYNQFLFSNVFTKELFQLHFYRGVALSVTHFLLSFAFPFVVIVSCYAVIIYRIRKNASLARRSSRTFKIIAAIVIVFFLCWAPFNILDLMELVSYKFRNKQLRNVIIGNPITTSLVYINSCVNPLLYVFIGQDFKDRAFKSILKALKNAFQDEDTPLDSNRVEAGQSNVTT